MEHLDISLTSGPLHRTDDDSRRAALRLVEATPRRSPLGRAVKARPLGLHEVALTAEARRCLERVVCEQQQREQLDAAGLRASRRLLLLGPAGTGKALTARAVAHELALPLLSYRLCLDDPGSETDLAFPQPTPGGSVMLLELVGQPGCPGAREQVRRLLGPWLADEAAGDSLVLVSAVTAGALGSTLPDAFDELVAYRAPQLEEIGLLLRQKLASLDLSAVAWTSVQLAAAGLSHGDLTRVAQQMLKHALLQGRATLGNSELLMALEERRAVRRQLSQPGG